MLHLLVGTDFPLMKYRRFTYVFSGALVLATAVWLLIHGGPKLSVDFSGGTLMRISTSQPISPDHLRTALDAAGMTGAELQQLAGTTGSEYLIRLKGGEGDVAAGVQNAISKAFPGITIDTAR